MHIESHLIFEKQFSAVIYSGHVGYHSSDKGEEGGNKRNFGEDIEPYPKLSYRNGVKLGEYTRRSIGAYVHT